MLKSIGFIGILLSLCFYGFPGEWSPCYSRCVDLFDDYMMTVAGPQGIANEFEDFCRNVSAAKSCFDATQCGPSDSGYAAWLTYLGDLEAFQYLCSRGAQVYRAQLHCIETNPALNASTFQCADSADLRSSSNVAKCRTMNNFLKCTYDVTKRVCGQDIANYAVTAAQKTLRRLWSYMYNCSLDISYVNGVGRTSSSVTSLVMLFILTLTLTRR